MSKLLELFEKRSKAVVAARSFLDSRRGSSDPLNPEDAAAYERMESEIINLGKEIDRENKLAAISADLEKPLAAPITNAPAGSDAPKTGRASAEYGEDFAHALRGRPTVHNVLSTSPDADGGYLVPVEFEKRIITGLYESNVIRRIARIINTSAERKIPIAADKSVARWTRENAPIQESQLTFTQKTIDAYKLTDLIRISIELLQDSMFNLEHYIADDFARAFGVAEEEAFCVGTGQDQPTGIFLEKGGAEIGVTTNGKIDTDNLIDLVYALKSPYRRNAVFLMKDITVSGIRKLKDANGQYLWQPSVQAGEPDRLLGYRLYTSPYAPDAAPGSLPIAFGDFNHYWVADRMGRTVQRLNELYAGNGQVGFISTQRVDGKVILAEGIQLLKVAGSTQGA